jgi:hypothetical protein
LYADQYLRLLHIIRCICLWFIKQGVPRSVLTRAAPRLVLFWHSRQPISSAEAVFFGLPPAGIGFPTFPQTRSGACNSCALSIAASAPHICRKNENSDKGTILLSVFFRLYAPASAFSMRRFLKYNSKSAPTKNVLQEYTSSTMLGLNKIFPTRPDTYPTKIRIKNVRLFPPGFLLLNDLITEKGHEIPKHMSITASNISDIYTNPSASNLKYVRKAGAKSSLPSVLYSIASFSRIVSVRSNNVFLPFSV